VAQPVRLEAPAKLNLGLRVLGRRSDGYHLLQSLVVFLDLADRIEIAPALAWRLRTSGRFAHALDGEDNLVLRAGKALAQHATADIAGCSALAADIALEKNIPVAAGLGGGSADAAAVLKGLDAAWQLGLAMPQLQEIAAPLGADLAVCLSGVPAMVGGIGERIAPIALPSLSLVVANPGIPLATKDVFKRLTPPYAEELPVPRLASAGDAVDFARALGNSLAAPAIELCPTVAALLSDISALEGCRLAQMSGSGASCFGVFDDDAVATRAASALQAKRPGWFVRACRSRSY
jgi:4-diphosphocytidyl-2-C-methyl-D-erythritol kinase